VISLISTRQVARVPAAVLALVASAALAGCGGESGPVARVSVEPDAVELAYPATARLTTSWEMTVPLDAEGRPVVFVHLIGAEGEVDRTFDFPLTVEWRPGETATVPVPLWQSALGPPLAPGSYRLTLGLYDSAAGRRWPLATAGEEVARQEYEVARVDHLQCRQRQLRHAGRRQGFPQDGPRRGQLVGDTERDGLGRLNRRHRRAAGRHQDRKGLARPRSAALARQFRPCRPSDHDHRHRSQDGVRRI
jgi:hypothetical protein